MSTQPFSVLYPRIRTKAMKASLPETDIAILEAARELCLRSTVWRDSVSINVQANLPEYSLVDTNADAEVVDIEAAQWNANSALVLPLQATSPEFVDDTLADDSYPSNFFLDPPSRIVVGPLKTITTNIPAGLWVRVVLQPSLTATTLDAGLLQRADQAIVDGAVSRLLLTKGTPWHDPALGAAHRRMFETGLAKAKTAAELGFQKTNLQTAVWRY